MGPGPLVAPWPMLSSHAPKAPRGTKPGLMHPSHGPKGPKTTQTLSGKAWDCNARHDILEQGLTFWA